MSGRNSNASWCVWSVSLLIVNIVVIAAIGFLVFG